MKTKNKIVRKVCEENVLRIVMGILLTLFLIGEASAAGIVWTWGFNNYGQLGDGTRIDKPNPVQVVLSDGTPLTVHFNYKTQFDYRFSNNQLIGENDKKTQYKQDV